MSKKILIVGGCGFIGHNLALELKKVGHEPYVIDSLAINNIYSIDAFICKFKFYNILTLS